MGIVVVVVLVVVVSVVLVVVSCGIVYVGGGSFTQVQVTGSQNIPRCTLPTGRGILPVTRCPGTITLQKASHEVFDELPSGAPGR